MSLRLRPTTFPRTPTSRFRFACQKRAGSARAQRSGPSRTHYTESLFARTTRRSGTTGSRCPRGRRAASSRARGWPWVGVGESHRDARKRQGRPLGQDDVQVARHLEDNNPSELHVAIMVNLNKWHEGKAEKAAELKGKSMARGTGSRSTPCRWTLPPAWAACTGRGLSGATG